MTKRVRVTSGGGVVLMLALSACEAKNGADDDVGAEIDMLCAEDCNERIQCLAASASDPDKWKAEAVFCADDQLFSMDDLVLRSAQIIQHCRALMNLAPDDEAKLDWEFISCPGSQPGDCPDWSPADHVTPRAGDSFLIEEAFAEDILLDPSPLTACDTTYLVIDGDVPGLTVVNVSMNDLTATMGLRSGDIIHSLNQHRLETLGDAFGALVHYRNSDDRSFDLGLTRGDQSLVMHYEVVP